MPGRISDEKFQEVLASIAIVDLIGERVALRPAGREFTGLCPFHNEKTPSFSVNPEKGLYHCHGCGAGGNAITFLREVEGLTAREALEELARRSGIELQEADPRAAREAERRRTLLAALAWAEERYRTAFRTAPGAVAREYMERRGFRPETLEAFGIGWAPAGWDNLARAAARDGIDPTALEEAGLLSRRPHGEGRYDFFRERILFPIRDEGGRVLGFGGRVLAGKEKKYINSRHTPVYNKSRVLYGLDLARAAAAKHGLFVVEGYTDVMGLHQAGRPNVVASLGTAFTQEQADLVKRYVRDNPVILLFDSDEAGERAAERGIENFLARDLAVRVVTLPGGRDPDEFVEAEGPEALDALVETAEDFLDFKIRVAGRRHGTDTLDGLAAAIDAVLATVARLANPIKRRLALSRLSAAFPVPVDELESRLLELLAGRTAPRPAIETRPEPLRPATAVRPPDRPEAPPRLPSNELKRRILGEEFLIQALLFQPDLADEIRLAYRPDHFVDPELGAIARELLSNPRASAGSLDPSAGNLEPKAAERLTQIRRRHEGRPTRTEIDYRSEFAKFLANVEKTNLRAQLQRRAEELARARAEGDQEAVRHGLRACDSSLRSEHAEGRS